MTKQKIAEKKLLSASVKFYFELAAAIGPEKRLFHNFEKDKIDYIANYLLQSPRKGTSSVGIPMLKLWFLNKNEKLYQEEWTTCEENDILKTNLPDISLIIRTGLEYLKLIEDYGKEKGIKIDDYFIDLSVPYVERQLKKYLCNNARLDVIEVLYFCAAIRDALKRDLYKWTTHKNYKNCIW